MYETNHLRWSSASLSHVGKVRQDNQDSCLALPEAGLWVVADGMGGHAAGELASHMIINTLGRLAPSDQWEDFVEQVQACLQQTNRSLCELSTRLHARRTVGSTVVVLLAHDNQGTCLWVGDSRLYLLREGELEQLTRDHSYVQELVDKGQIKPREARVHPQNNVITRAVGQRNDLLIDRIDFPLQAGDVFLLCSDGLNKMVSDAEIDILLSCGSCQDTVQSLIDLALRRGAYDNVTAVVVTVNDDVTAVEALR
jgi:serine/threonine protein phosphatase PrpC